MFGRILGFVSEVLLTLGYLVLAFAVWLVYWTDVEFNQAQEEVKSGISWVQPRVEDSEDGVRVALPQEGDPPILEYPQEEGSIWATIIVPSWGTGYEQLIHQGTNKKRVLDKLGVGHMVTSEVPGEIGNFVVAGHRVTYGKPFNQMAELQVGDAVVIRTESYWYVYKLEADPYIIYPNQVEVLQSVPGSKVWEEPTERFMTMVACHPMGSARQRIIAHPKFEYWALTEDGFPQELIDLDWTGA